jgi:hypothetical protein
MFKARSIKVNKIRAITAEGGGCLFLLELPLVGFPPCNMTGLLSLTCFPLTALLFVGIV